MTEIRPVEPSDYGPLATFLAGQVRPQDPRIWRMRMSHWWDENPAFAADCPRGWCAESAGRIVGFIANVPRLEYAAGAIQRSSNPCSWVVHPEYRNASLQLFGSLLASPAPIYIATTPGDIPARVLPALGFKPFPGRQRLIESLLVVNAAAILTEAARRREQRILPILALLAGRLALPLMEIWLAINDGHRQDRARLRTSVIGDASEISPAFDRLWRDARDRYAFTAVRSADVLRWRAFGGPLYPKLMIACWNDKETLAGYCILARRENEGLHVLSCLDMFLADENPRVVEALVQAARSVAAEQRASLVAFRHFSPFLAQTFRKLRLPRRAVEGRELYRSGQAAECTLDERTSYLTEFNGERWL